jgi:DNA-binding CsgD family transcriptional regulator
MSSMQDKFDAELRSDFEAAARDRDNVELIKKLSHKGSEELAMRIVAAIPHRMEDLREQIAREWSVDIAVPQELVDLTPRSFEENVSLLRKVNYYRALDGCFQKLNAYMADSSLSKEELAAKVCEVGVKALQTCEAAMLHTLREIRVLASSQSSEEAAQIAQDTEARHLAAHLATRISVGKNRRLAKVLDEIREHIEPANRERFVALLRELYVLAPEVWDEHHRTDWSLLTTRSAVVKKIERRLSTEPLSSLGETELATFDAQERLLKKGRDAGLTPREYELLKLFVENPNMPYREAAQRMGIAVGTVGTLKSRIKKSLNAAF